MSMVVQDILSNRTDSVRHEAVPLSDHEAWNIYQALVGYGVPMSEAQIIVDTLARRPVPDIRQDDVPRVLRAVFG